MCVEKDQHQTALGEEGKWRNIKKEDQNLPQTIPRERTKLDKVDPQNLPEHESG